jgi:hypothetical protein
MGSPPQDLDAREAQRVGRRRGLGGAEKGGDGETQRHRDTERFFGLPVTMLKRLAMRSRRI